MAFNIEKLARFSAGEYGSNGIVGYTYKNDGDALATIKASGYFDGAKNLVKDDVIYVLGSDGHDMLYVVSLSPTVTGDYIDASAPSVPDGSITAAKLATDAVETLKIKDANVTEGKLASAVTAKLLGTNNVVAANLGAASVETAAIKDANVTDAKLESSLTKIVQMGGGTASNATNTAFTLSGVEATDIALAQFTSTATVACCAAVCTANTVTVHYSGTAAGTETVKILVIRPTS